MPFRCRSAEQCLILVNSQSNDISVSIKTVYLSGKTSTEVRKVTITLQLNVINSLSKGMTLIYQWVNVEDYKQMNQAEKQLELLWRKHLWHQERQSRMSHELRIGAFSVSSRLEMHMHVDPDDVDLMTYYSCIRSRQMMTKLVEGWMDSIEG